MRVQPPDGEPVLTIDTGAVVEIGFFNARDKINLSLTVYVSNNEGVLLFATGHLLSCNEDSRVANYRLVGTIPPLGECRATLSQRGIWQRPSVCFYSDWMKR